MEKRNENVELSGLSEAEVTLRLQQHGYNELPSSKGRSILATAWDVVREPMFLLLLACGTIYLILGDVQEAVMLLGFVFVVLGITLYQERKTELFAKVVAAGHEGVMAKKHDSRYLAGQRSSSWRKIKPELIVPCVIIGYQAGRSGVQRLACRRARRRAALRRPTNARLHGYPGR